MARAAVQLSPEVEQQLAIAVPRLVDEFHPLRIYLYGSQARGDATEDSDIDVLLVMPDGFRAKWSDYGQSALVLSRGASNVNVAFISLTGYLGRLDWAASFPATIAREGRLLYEA